MEPEAAAFPPPTEPASPQPPPAFPPQAPLLVPFPDLPAVARLSARSRWVAYQAVWLPAKGKWTKVPYNPRSDPKAGRKAATNEPATWGTLAQATAFARAAGAAGVGYMFRAPPPIADEEALAGVDLDACRDPATGEVAPWAWEIVRRLDSYTEASPTATGVHVLVEGALPPGWRKRALDGGHVEMYDWGRFFTVTGRHLDGTRTTIEPRAEALARLHAELAGPDARAPVTPQPAGPPALGDQELLEHASRAANGPAFDRLWRGDRGGHGGDDSAADLALCNLLRFWTGADPVRMDRLFRRSGLMRPKWDERRGDRTYGERTLARALAGGGDVYASHGEGPATSVVGVTTEVPLSPDRDSFSAFSRNARTSSGGAPANAPNDPIGEVPPLPPEAWLPDEVAQEGDAARGVWLERYVDAARALSPRTPRTLHEAAGIFALATVIARRAYVQVGGRRLYPCFYLAFVERSTLYSKTGGLEVLRQALEAAGLQDLLLPSSFTPQALLSDLALQVPVALREGRGEEQGQWLERHRHAAQRAIVRDELAGLFEDCTRDYNAGLLPLVLKLDGAPERIDPDLTLSRGLVEVRRVCVSLLGATTPAAFRPHATKAYHWANGLFGRFALLAAGEPPAYAFWPERVTGLPAEVVDGLTAVYRSFPIPRASFVYADPGERDRPGRPERRDAPDGPRIAGAVQEGYGAVAFAVDAPAWRAWRRYDEALFGIVRRDETSERLDATYGRLPTSAVRLALTLAATEWALDGGPASGLAPLVELRHWAAAQEIAERWRRHAHGVLADALRDEAADDASTGAARLVKYLGRAGGHQKRSDLQRGLNLSSTELDAAIAAAGPRVRTWEEKTRGQPARWVALAGEASARDDGSPTQGTEGTEAPHQRGRAPTSVVPATTEVPREFEATASGAWGRNGHDGRQALDDASTEVLGCQ